MTSAVSLRGWPAVLDENKGSAKLDFEATEVTGLQYIIRRSRDTNVDFVLHDNSPDQVERLRFYTSLGPPTHSFLETREHTVDDISRSRELNNYVDTKERRIASFLFLSGCALTLYTVARC